MTRTELSFPELGLLVGTRGMLGAGIALLLAHKHKLDAEKRIPSVLMVFGRRKQSGT